MFGFRRNKQPPPVAHRLEFLGKGAYEHRLADSDFGLVVEDDGGTGYLYVTNSSFSFIYDALHLYDHGDADQLNPGEEVYLVWSATLQKAGLYYRGRFQAGVNFNEREARCRSGFPARLENSPWKSDHTWNDSVVSGLEP